MVGSPAHCLWRTIPGRSPIGLRGKVWQCVPSIFGVVGSRVLVRLIRETEQLDESQGAWPLRIFAHYEKVLPVLVRFLRVDDNFSNRTWHGERRRATDMSRPSRFR